MHLAVRDGTEVLYLDRLRGSTSVPIVSTVGSRLPLHATGVGKVLLAHAPAPVQQQVLADLPRITPYTVTQPGRLRRQLAQARRDDYATTVEEMSLGACSVAVPDPAARRRGGRAGHRGADPQAGPAAAGGRAPGGGARHRARRSPFHPAETRDRPGPSADRLGSTMDDVRTQVAIIGAGPAGLLLSHLLAADGVESVVVESRSEEYVAARIRAGILEQSTVDLLRSCGLGERLERDGDPHRGIYLQWPGERHHLDFVDLTGRSVWVYGQTEVQKDLVAARRAAGRRSSTRCPTPPCTTSRRTRPR